MYPFHPLFAYNEAHNRRNRLRLSRPAAPALRCRVLAQPADAAQLQQLESEGCTTHVAVQVSRAHSIAELRRKRSIAREDRGQNGCETVSSIIGNCFAGNCLLIRNCFTLLIGNVQTSLRLAGERIPL